MPTRLIRLADGVLVEVETAPGAFHPIAAGSAVDAVDAAIDKASGTILKVCQSLATAVKNVSSTVHVSEVEAEVGLAFEAEGNLYITKAKTTASITVRITMALDSHDNEK